MNGDYQNAILDTGEELLFVRNGKGRKKETLSSAYGILVTLVDPKRFYWVEYTIMQDGTRVKGKQQVKGADLTEKQIVDLFFQGQFFFEGEGSKLSKAKKWSR